jgi:acetylornithine deacetylase/succinyl-diaminopimelate desuccinylase-like protein
MRTATVIAPAMAALLALVPAPGAGQDAESDPRLPEASLRLQQYLRIDTTNPPGNESEAVAFFADIFEREGIAYQTVEPEPGRGSIWARLEGGQAPGIILLHHIDVVPADPRFWKHDPLSGTYENGYLNGRGALDTKGLGIMHLEAFLALAHSGKPLNRDVIFLATADEEAGGLLGAGWLVRHRPDLLEGVGLLLNEGGSGRILGNRVVFSVEVTQKVPLWLRLNAVGPAGHGSSPTPRSAVTDLVEALERLRQNPFAPRIVPAVGDFFRNLADLEAGAADLADPEGLIARPDRLAALHRTNPMLHALTRNTCAVTRLEASSKINVVAPAATAELDCRLLPDQSPRLFIRDLRAALDQPSISIEVLISFTPAVSSTDTDLYRALESVTARRYPGSTLMPAVTAGFTDSHFFRDLGIVAYGFSPAIIPSSDQGGVHGNNERISVQNVERGWQTMLDLLQTIAVESGRQPASASGITPTAGGQD